MITGAHLLLYTSKPDEMRRFFRDVLELRHVDAGDGWLIFALPPAEMGVHPTDTGREHHELTLMCDDLQATVARLQERGARLTSEVAEQRWGESVTVALPDGSDLMLYQPGHPLAR